MCILLLLVLLLLLSPKIRQNPTTTCTTENSNNNNNNNNVTCIAQIRQSRKCAATCQCQTGMFSVDFRMWPEISQLSAGRVAENSTRRDHERRNYGRRNLPNLLPVQAANIDIIQDH